MRRSTVACIIAFLLLPGPSYNSSDNLGSLASTLKDMHRAACDDERVSLACPTGTVIYIQEAKYGNRALAPEYTCLQERDGQVTGDNCLWPNAMQYSLLKTVVEACQKKPSCQFSTRLMEGVTDPCPNARKFVRVAFKCRPYEFRSRVVCEGDILKLSCNPYSRVAVYDAEYGRTAFESECSEKGVNDENCKAPTAASAVMQLCHGKRRCEIQASSSFFGNPCKSKVRLYLKVVYACVPLGVLTEQYETALEDDEAKEGVTGADRASDLFDTSVNSGEKWTESYTPRVIPALPPPKAASTPMPPNNEVVSQTPKTNMKNDTGNPNSSTYTVHLPSALPPPKAVSTPMPPNKEVVSQTPKTNMKNDGETSQQNIFIYVGISVLLFVILSIMLIAVRCYIIRKNARKSKNGDMFIAETPNVFNDAMSDIDNDIDVTHISGTFYDPAHPDMILYRDVQGSKGAIRAMRPLSTIYPCAGASMYGNLDYVPPPYREAAAGRLSRETSRDKEDVEIDHEVVVSPKSLGRYSNSQYYYG